MISIIRFSNYTVEKEEGNNRRWKLSVLNARCLDVLIFPDSLALREYCCLFSLGNLIDRTNHMNFERNLNSKTCTNLHTYLFASLFLILRRQDENISDDFDDQSS